MSLQHLPKLLKETLVYLLRARAIENFCYIFAPNQTENTKPEKHLVIVIISPVGKILKIKMSGTGVIYSNIDVDLPIDLRNRIPSLKLNTN